jgi:hypothetical protein
MKFQLLLGLLVCLALATTSLKSEAEPVASEAPTFASEGDHQGEVVPRLEPHGEQLCASGCALSRHPTPELTEQKFLDLMLAYSSEPMTEESPALEELLFFGVQTERFLRNSDEIALDPERLAFLQKELSRDKVVAEFRILDDTGTVRVGLPPTEVSLDRRYVFEPLNTQDFQPPEASGTVKRVGLNHVWQRI